MLAPEIITKMRSIEIQTRRLLNNALVGDSRSALKGAGTEFDQIREYHQGDDIRFIHWSSSMKAGKLLVREYQEERSRTIWLVVDVSSSALYTSTGVARSEIIAQIASVLALVANYGKDQVGLLLFAQEVELVVPLSKGIRHVHRIMESLFKMPSMRKQTELRPALDYLARLKSKDSIVFIISDFIFTAEHALDKLLAVVSKKHDIVAIRCLDTYEHAFPAVGYLHVEDPETGICHDIGVTNGKKGSFAHMLEERCNKQRAHLYKYGIDLIDIPLNKPFMGDLIRFFRRRMVY